MDRASSVSRDGPGLAPLHWTAIAADRLRARILSYSLRLPFIRGLFHDRPRRLAAIFLVAFPFNLALAVFVPLWALLLGPILFGIPHLVASSAYVSRCAARSAVAPPNAAALAGALFLAIALSRVWADAHGFDRLAALPNWIELAGSCLAWLWLSYLAKPNPVELLTGGLLLGGLAASSIATPFWTLGVLVLAHNGVAFIYWTRRARTTADRHTAIFSLSLFCLGTAAILAGLFDSAANAVASDLSGGSFNVTAIGQSILPGTEDSTWWTRAVMAYAFGQSQHYIVWLKALPEQDLPHQHPIGFSKSARLFERRNGRILLYAAAYGAGALFVYAAYAGLQEARTLYLAVAVFHGYFEIAGLAFIRKA
jgi:hypothetical protein